MEYMNLDNTRLKVSLGCLVYDAAYAGAPACGDRDPHVDNDVPVVRHNREEEILFVWSGLTLVLLTIGFKRGARDVNSFKSSAQIRNASEKQLCEF